MKAQLLQAAIAPALFLASAPLTSAGLHGHKRAHQLFGREHDHSVAHASRAEGTLAKRATCSLPDHPDIVRVPGADNGGFAMAPDRSCSANEYCPFACKPGMVMAQWQKGSNYQSTSRMNGGILCDSSGKATKPFPDKAYCVQGTGAVSVHNECGEVVTFCQTQLPGDEAMYISTEVASGSTQVIAVPGPEYWDGTSAHYYINEPGLGAKDACVWGTSSKACGNWAPYVAGANTDNNGQTFVKLGYNPKYHDDFSGHTPEFGVKITCDDSAGCNGLPCEINPRKTHNSYSVVSKNSATGAGNADFCVVTVPKGAKAVIDVFPLDGSKAQSSSSSESAAPSEKKVTTEPTKTSTKAPEPTTTTTTTSSATTTSSTTTSAASTTTTSTTTSSEQTTSSESSDSSSANITVRPGIFHENGTSTYQGTGQISPKPTGTGSSSSSESSATTTSKNDSAGTDRGGAAIAGLIIALSASFWLY